MDGEVLSMGSTQHTLGMFLLLGLGQERWAGIKVGLGWDWALGIRIESAPSGVRGC